MSVRRDPKVTSRIMSAVKSRDTRPELLLRRALYRRGLRYRVGPRSVPGRPDVAFPQARVAVFVDGDFWHGCPTHFPDRRPGGPNASLWLTKFEAVKQRDARATRLAEEVGWHVVRVWECELTGDLESVVERILRIPKSSNT